ncbi:MAG: pyridoxamine 5'-phosphate oxidase family protein [Actinomycetes bacterium]
MTDTSRSGLHELSRQECLDLLASQPVGRIAATVEFLPFIFPVNFRMYGDRILIRTVSGTKLHAALTGQVVAFEADGFTTDGKSGWSVLVRGGAEEVTDPKELEKAELVPIHNFAFNEQPGRIVLISTVGISGRYYDHTEKK